MLIVSHVAVSSPGAEGAAGSAERVEPTFRCHEGIFTVDVEADPARIDIEFVEGPEAGNWSYGIYTLDGDALVMCLGLTGAPRPQRFATAAGSGQALERLRRTSPARPAGVKGGRSEAATARKEPAAAVVDEAAFRAAMTPLLKDLQGEWAPVTLISNGQPLPAAMLSMGVRTITGNETKVVFGGQVMVHAKMRLDESRTPVAVDYLNIGRGPRTVSLGILERRAHLVRICMAPPDRPRPGDFSSEKGSGHIFSEWKRSSS